MQRCNNIRGKISRNFLDTNTTAFFARQNSIKEDMSHDHATAV